jgi:Zn-dependent metalloprotease
VFVVLFAVGPIALGAPTSNAATAHTQYGGTVRLDTFRTGPIHWLQDPSRGTTLTLDLAGATSGGTVFFNTSNVWGDGRPERPDTQGADAQYGATVAYDYFLRVHQRTGIWGDGTGSTVRVRWGNAEPNASWDGHFVNLGAGVENRRPLTSLDIVGHELTHALIDATARLTYSGEPGAVNEATADIFGTAIEFFANNPSDPGDYLIGEKVNVTGNGGPVRRMDRPSSDGGSVDCWSPDVGRLDVHYGSGVGNHFFFLLAEGSGPRVINGVQYDSPVCEGPPLKGISREAAERIWYRALTRHMNAGTNWAGARRATLQAAEELFGIASREQQAVAAAWDAVRVEGPPAPRIVPLKPNVPVSDLRARAGEPLLFRLELEPGLGRLEITTEGGSGDADLYVRAGEPPSREHNDCQSTAPGNRERCVLTHPRAGPWFVMLWGTSDFSGVELKAVTYR